MSRSNDIPVISGEFPGVLKVQQGGTGEVSAAAVRSVHGLVNRDLLGEPGGVATMKVGLGTPMDPVDNDIILQGSTMVMKGDTVEILIVNFDSGKEYNITAEGGEAVLVGDKIFYTAGYEEGFFKLTVNGRVVHMSVADAGPGDVRIFLPLNDELWKSNTVVFSCTPYRVSGLKGEWERTEWEVFVDGGIESSIELFDVTQNETELSLNNVKRFDSVTVRCRFVNKEGSKSNWSNKYTIDVDKEDPGYYPIQKLTGTNNGYFGTSVAMSHDGSMVIIGAGGNINSSGNYAEIYGRSGSNYTLVQKLTGTGYFGQSVAMNHDGSMVIVGTDSTSSGNYAEIYERSGSEYTLVKKLTGTGLFGRSVAMNHDGSMVIVGAYNGNYAEIYERSGSEYALVQKLTGTGGFGYSVAMNHDGSMVIVGTSSGNYAEIYQRSGTNYTLVKKLTGIGRFGWSVAMNHDGSMVIVGTSSGNYAEIYQRSGSEYVLVQKLTSTGSFGKSVAMNHDGSMVIVGTEGSGSSNTPDNSAYIYVRSDSEYILVQQLTGTGYFGKSVAMTPDGSMVIVGTVTGRYAEIIS